MSAKDANDLVERLFENVHLISECPKEILDKLQLIDNYIQVNYFGNLKEGNTEAAVIGLMVGVRAAYIQGYIAAITQTNSIFNRKDLQ